MRDVEWQDRRTPVGPAFSGPGKLGRLKACPTGITLLFVAAGCTPKPAAPATTASAAAPAIKVVKPERKAITRVVEQPGAVEPSEEVALFAKLPGFVARLAPDAAAPGKSIDIGCRVKAGQVLAELAIPELVEEAKQKEALVRLADAEVEQAVKALAAADAGVASAEAMVAEAKAGLGRSQALYDRWQSESGRITGLVRSGVMDAQARDETLNQFRSAQATRDEAVAHVASAEAAARKAVADRGKAAADVTADEARRDVAKADARRTGALLGYTKVVAPFDGVVTRRSVSPGDYLDADDKNGVFTVARLDPVRVVVRVPEADAGLVKDGTPVKVTVQALAGPELTGVVARTSWSLEPGSRTLRAEVDVPNPDGKVRPGMYAYARITATFPEGWAVPAAAVGKAGDDFVVYLAEGGRAVRTPVQVGRGDGQVTQVRRLKKPEAADWVEFAGSEEIAVPAAALTDGQVLPPVR